VSGDNFLTTRTNAIEKGRIDAQVWIAAQFCESVAQGFLAMTTKVCPLAFVDVHCRLRRLGLDTEADTWKELLADLPLDYWVNGLDEPWETLEASL
jgi:hypothetical protein